eukprot:TRINITY_DN7049_c0_g2_i2.p1 TRINITY_DN7049_c0_g2~~TRINITY_DN7049_c0_g2_i2.p1  ORF type:complete len:369 (+),score=40.21 TRINITY_DN7049_c0_g2_i2:36-1142(+)
MSRQDIRKGLSSLNSNSGYVSQQPSSVYINPGFAQTLPSSNYPQYSGYDTIGLAQYAQYAAYNQTLLGQAFNAISSTQPSYSLNTGLGHYGQQPPYTDLSVYQQQSQSNQLPSAFSPPASYSTQHLQPYTQKFLQTQSTAQQTFQQTELQPAPMESRLSKKRRKQFHESPSSHFVPPQEREVPPREGKASQPSQFYCNLCDSDCSGQSSYDSHIKGRKHQRKIKLQSGQGEPSTKEIASPYSKKILIERMFLEKYDEIAPLHKQIERILDLLDRVSENLKKLPIEVVDVMAVGSFAKSVMLRSNLKVDLACILSGRPKLAEIELAKGTLKEIMSDYEVVQAHTKIEVTSKSDGIGVVLFSWVDAFSAG